MKRSPTRMQQADARSLRATWHSLAIVGSKRGYATPCLSSAVLNQFTTPEEDT